MRCLEQKWPAQKLQSPTMRWAASLHSLKLQRGLRGGIVYRVVVGVLWEARYEGGETPLSFEVER